MRKQEKRGSLDKKRRIYLHLEESGGFRKAEIHQWPLAAQLFVCAAPKRSWLPGIKKPFKDLLKNVHHVFCFYFPPFRWIHSFTIWMCSVVSERKHCGSTFPPRISGSCLNFLLFCRWFACKFKCNHVKSRWLPDTLSSFFKRPNKHPDRVRKEKPSQFTAAVVCAEEGKKHTRQDNKQNASASRIQSERHISSPRSSRTTANTSDINYALERWRIFSSSFAPWPSTNTPLSLCTLTYHTQTHMPAPHCLLLLHMKTKRREMQK